MKMAAQHPAEKLIAENRKARHDYFVLEQLETGISLAGTEVKSLRLGEVNLKDSWVEIENGELFVLGMHISPYEKGNIFNRDPVRKRNCWRTNLKFAALPSSKNCRATPWCR